MRRVECIMLTKGATALLTAFQGTSAEVMVKKMTHCDILILPNDKVKDAQLLIDTVSRGTYDYVISLGQRPNVKDKVYIETTARHGTEVLKTAFDCEKLRRTFKELGITAKLSHNAGTSFCNELYWNGLKDISDNNLNIQMVFVHVPFEKNISNMECFQKSLQNSIRVVVEKS